MIMKGAAKKLSIFVDETDRYHNKPVYEALLDLFYREKIAGASVFRGFAGYGSDGVFHTAKMLELSSSLPIKIEVIDSAENINRLIPFVTDMVSKGLIEITDTTIISCRTGTE